MENWVTDFSGFCNLETSKNRTRYMMFPYYIIWKPPKHLFSRQNSSDYIIRTVSAQILNMFVTWIVILGTTLIFLTLILLFWVHCYLFLIKIRVFGLLGRIAPKLPQKKFKDDDSPRRDFLRDSAPSKSKFHCLDPFSF